LALGGKRVADHYYYSSILTRTVSGIPVIESHAWARFDGGGNVVAENVYWPAFDAGVVSDAVGLSQALSRSPQASATYLAKLPLPEGMASSGRVVIHHSSEFVRSSFESYACYDVLFVPSGGGGYERHFDINGVELRLPQELRAANPPL
jgi:hypothetical protein